MASKQKFSDKLWESIVPIWDKIVKHPFFTELTNGKLSEKAFDFYIVQDYLYLKDYGKGLAMIAVKADTNEQSQLFLKHAASIFQVECDLHRAIFKSDNISETEARTAQIAPNCLLYVCYLMRIAYERPLHEIIAAFLPCLWIYWEVGKMLKSLGSPKENYQKWIDTYASDDFGDGVKAVINIMDNIAEELTEGQRKLLVDHFVMTSKMEYMFWDMGYIEQQWPV